MKLPEIKTPMTYAEIAEKLSVKDKKELKKNPFSLSIELCKAVNSKKLKYRSEKFITHWPLYGPGKREQPKRRVA